MQVKLKTENAHDNFFAYDVHRLELKAIGDQVSVSLQDKDILGMSVLAYVRSNHFDAEVGTLPERFAPKSERWKDDGNGLAETATYTLPERLVCQNSIVDLKIETSGSIKDGVDTRVHYCEVFWIDPKTGLATPHKLPRRAAYLAVCKTAPDNVPCGVCQEHYDSYCTHGVQMLTNWDFEKL